MSLSVGGTRHLQALLGSLGRLARSPLSTFLTLLVISLALALPTALRLLVTNAQLATGNFANAIDVSVYLKTDVPLAKAQQLAQSAGQRLDVAAVTLIPADKGLEEFRTYSGFGDALAALKENPLPHVLHVRPRLEAGGNAALESLRRYFGAWPEVDLVQVDAEWVMRFNAILEVLRRLLMMAAAFLGVGVLAVIGNTIRLEIQGRRAEIEVTKLVGGSNSYVRRGAAGSRRGARMARSVDLGGAASEKHRAARLRAPRTRTSWGRQVLVAAEASCVTSVASIHLRTRRASATRVRLPKELSSTITTVRSSITVCITRHRPAREM